MVVGQKLVEKSAISFNALALRFLGLAGLSSLAAVPLTAAVQRLGCWNQIRNGFLQMGQSILRVMGFQTTLCRGLGRSGCHMGRG